jgi:GT2 family glycosyltransferase
MNAVVIVNWNGRQLLDACLEAVFAQSRVPQLVIVVDNGSTDGSLEYLGSRWPAVRVVALGRNAGVAAGNNVGIRAALEADARYILLLNTDAILDPGVIGELSDALVNGGDQVWAAAPKILFRSEPDRIWSAGGRFEWWRGVSRDRGTGEPDRGQYDTPIDIDYSNTCCLLIRAEAFAAVGLMDEAYFMYYDDSDFSARVRRAGGRIRYVPAARVLHDVQSSSGGTQNRPSPFALYYTTRNRARFIRRNAPSLRHRIIAHCFTIGSRVTRIGQALARGRWQEATLVGRALRDGYLRRQTGASDGRVTSW